MQRSLLSSSLRVRLVSLVACTAALGGETGLANYGETKNGDLDGGVIAPEEEVYGQLIAAGAIEGFEATESDMPVEDMQCLLTGLDGGDGAVFSASSNFVHMLEQILTRSSQTWSIDKRHLAELEGGMQALLELEAAVASGCLHDRVLRSLRLASDALLSLKMQGGRFTAGKADVHDDLVIACRHFKAVDYRSFGRDLGRIWRIVLNSGTPLEKTSDFMDPEEVQGGQAPASLDAIAEVTSSLLSSFLTDGASRGLSESWEHPTEFRQCVQQEHDDLEVLWTKVGVILGGNHDDGSTWRFSSGSEADAQREADQLASLADMLGDLPSILRGCGLQEISKVLLEKSLDVLRRPPESLQNSAVAALLVIGKRWTASAWQDSGSRLGLLMQDMLLDAFPQKFHFDGSGRLREGSPLQTGANFHVLLVIAAGLVVPIAGVLAAKAGSLSRGFRMAMFRVGPQAESEAGMPWTAQAADKFLETRTLEGANLLRSDDAVE